MLFFCEINSAMGLPKLRSLQYIHLSVSSLLVFSVMLSASWFWGI